MDEGINMTKEIKEEIKEEEKNLTEKDQKKDSKKKTTKKSAASKKQQELDAQLNEIQQQLLDITKERDELQTFAEEAKDQSLRSLAELENVRRRKEQEKNDAIKFANEQLIIDLLPILDSFDLAINQMDSKDSNLESLVTGVQLIKKQLDQFLNKFGVVRIAAIDQPFDPNLHQGISQESHPDKDENTVIKEMQPGYQLNDRVIRPSMVVVSTK